MLAGEPETAWTHHEGTFCGGNYLAHPTKSMCIQRSFNPYCGGYALQTKVVGNLLTFHMIEPSTVGAALAAGRHAVDLVKNLHSSIKESGKSEVIEKFLDLQSAMLDLQEKQHALID